MKQTVIIILMMPVDAYLWVISNIMNVEISVEIRQ